MSSGFLDQVNGPFNNSGRDNSKFFGYTPEKLIEHLMVMKFIKKSAVISNGQGYSLTFHFCGSKINLNATLMFGLSGCSLREVIEWLDQQGFKQEDDRITSVSRYFTSIKDPLTARLFLIAVFYANMLGQDFDPQSDLIIFPASILSINSAAFPANLSLLLRGLKKMSFDFTVKSLENGDIQLIRS